MITWSFFNKFIYLTSVNGWGEIFASIKKHLLKCVMGYLSEPYFSLLNSLVLGGEIDRGDAVYQSFQALGLVHILSISGYNLRLILDFTRVFLSKFFWGLLLNLILLGVIVFYLFLAEGGVSMFRAGLMLIFSLMGIVLKRQNKAIFLLFLTCLVMFLLDSSIFSSLSFQFSVAATIAILLIYPFLRSIFISKKIKIDFSKQTAISRLSFYLKDNLFLNLSILIVMLPLQLYYFGQFNFLSIAANLFLAWIILILTYGSFLLLVGAAVSFLLPLDALLKVLALFLSSLAYLFLKIVELMAGFNFAVVNVGQFSYWWIILWWLVLLVLILKSNYEKNN